MAGFDDFLAILDDSEFEEIPVDIDSFIKDERYLNRPEFSLSPIQREAVLNSTQIYRKETLESFMTPEEAQRRWNQTNREVILMLGKGSGKDFMSGISCCYIIYLLLCLKDPAKYYGKPSGDSIDILNIAINAAQASNVFFANVSRLITKSNWFQGKYDASPMGQPARQNVFNFIKNVNLYSGHSEREAWEGLNCFMAVLDEISGFALESVSIQGKTADAIYKMHRASVDSRFPEFGKVVMLSFPRFKGDFISQRYDHHVVAKQVVKRSATLKLNPDLPDGFQGNEITIEWDEDHIEGYKFKGTYALKRPTWDVNPGRRIEDFAISFADDYVDSLGRFACMPPEAVDAFFKDRNKIEEAFKEPNGVVNEGDSRGEFHWDFSPKENVQYFVHVDLAQKHDRCAVALAHVDGWVTRKFGEKITEPAPMVIVDALRFWEPSKNNEVDFTEVQEYIVSLQRKGFNLRLVTFDQWRSEDMRKYLSSIGIRTDLLSIKKEQYVDMAVIMNESRLKGPDEPKLREELLQLRLFPNGKIDHMRQGYKDLSDATCGAIFNALTRTPRDLNPVIEVKTARDYRKAERNVVPENRNVIKAPKKTSDMPPEIRAHLQSIGII